MSLSCKFDFLKIAGLLLTVPLSMSAHAGHGTFSYTKKKVEFVREDGSVKRARRGQKVNVGDRIRTGSDSYAKVTMSDKNLIHIGPETEIVFQKYTTKDEGEPESVLNVVYGKVRTALEEKYDGKTSRFRVTTSAATLGVRGTDFLTEHSAEAEQTRATAFEGLIAVAGYNENGEPTESTNLMAGQMTLITFGSAPLEPIELPDGVIEAINTGSKQASKKTSFKQNAQSKMNSNMRSEVATRIAEVVNPVANIVREPLVEKNIILNNAENGGGDASVNFDIVDGT